MLVFTVNAMAQTELLPVKYDKEIAAKFEKYIEFKHSFTENYTTWKKANEKLCLKELWYYGKSFYVKRNAINEGITLDESIIDISRFENFRKENEEAIVFLPGFKDALVLLPNNKLIYKP